MPDEPIKLIRAAQRGDVQAFRALYDLFVGRVYAVCVRLLADRPKAEDACQETFIKVWQQLPRFRGDSSFGTWLHSIATRTTIDIWRKDRVLRLVDESDPEQFISPPEPENDNDLEQAIKSLPFKARAVFVLFAVEGYTHQEIADLLEIAEGSSKAHYHRARQLLREKLSQQPIFRNEKDEDSVIGHKTRR